MSIAFTWQIPVESQLIPSLAEWDTRISHGMFMLADLFAQQMQGQAQAGAPWNDVTGAARGGLRGFAAKEALQITIYLMHSVYYGPFLELGTSKMAPRPIILPTLQANYSAIMHAVRQLLL